MLPKTPYDFTKLPKTYHRALPRAAPFDLFNTILQRNFMREPGSFLFEYTFAGARIDLI